MPGACDSLPVTGRALLGLASADRISRPRRKSPVKTGGKSREWQEPNSNCCFTVQPQLRAAVLGT